jgi:hypothetical protein
LLGMSTSFPWTTTAPSSLGLQTSGATVIVVLQSKACYLHKGLCTGCGHLTVASWISVPSSSSSASSPAFSSPCLSSYLLRPHQVPDMALHFTFPNYCGLEHFQGSWTCSLHSGHLYLPSTLSNYYQSLPFLHHCIPDHTQNNQSGTLVVHTCNHIYLGGWDQEDCGSKPAQSNILWDSISKITWAKWTRSMAQSVESLLGKCEALSSDPIPPKK